MEHQVFLNYCKDIIQRHRALCVHWHKNEPRVFSNGVMSLIERNHAANFDLWHEEDIARRDDLPAERIRMAKRTIDRINQRRNDFIELIDAELQNLLKPVQSGCPQHSETPGMIIDRLSILTLKEYHMNEEVHRVSATPAHRRRCAEKLSVIRQQQHALLDSLILFLHEVRAQTRTFRVYRQYKMYNDPETNPELRVHAVS